MQESFPLAGHNQRNTQPTSRSTSTTANKSTKSTVVLPCERPQHLPSPQHQRTRSSRQGCADQPLTGRSVGQGALSGNTWWRSLSGRVVPCKGLFITKARETNRTLPAGSVAGIGFAAGPDDESLYASVFKTYEAALRGVERMSTEKGACRQKRTTHGSHNYLLLQYKVEANQMGHSQAATSAANIITRARPDQKATIT